MGAVSRSDTRTLDTVHVQASKHNDPLDQISGAASVVDSQTLDHAQVTSTLELDRVFPDVYMAYSATLSVPYHHDPWSHLS